MGYRNVKVLGGGVEAWKREGYPIEDRRTIPQPEATGGEGERPSDIA